MRIKRRNTLSVLLCLLMLLSLLPTSAGAEGASEAGSSGAAWNVRYAVSLYGIEQDSYEGGGKDKAGLTFGPATGGNYLQGYKAHVTGKAYRRDPENKLCLHWMTWEEIAEQSLKDPGVFRPCLENGCTHAVDICLNDTLRHIDYSGMTGDGANGLLNSLKAGFQSWNGGRLIPGGWPASRIRVTLNGADEYADVSVVGEEYMLDADTALFSCFPEELRQRIVAKAVVSDLDYDGKKSQCVTTYDKLWLFSAYEIYGGIQHSKAAEGPQYEKYAQEAVAAGTLPGGFEMYSEEGVAMWAWLRSASPLYDVINYHIFGGGHMIEAAYFNHYAVTPGFCLP